MTRPESELGDRQRGTGGWSVNRAVDCLEHAGQQTTIYKALTDGWSLAKCFLDAKNGRCIVSCPTMTCVRGPTEVSVKSGKCSSVDRMPQLRKAAIHVNKRSYMSVWLRSTCGLYPRHVPSPLQAQIQGHCKDMVQLNTDMGDAQKSERQTARFWPGGSCTHQTWLTTAHMSQGRTYCVQSPGAYADALVDYDSSARRQQHS